MNQQGIRDARRRLHLVEAQRLRHEMRRVRHPSRPDLVVERLLVCPSGVHVVTAAGSVPTGGMIQSGLVAAGREAAGVVAALLPERYRGRVRPVLCSDGGEPMADLVDDVLVTTTETLEHIVASSPRVLSTCEIDEIALRLEALMEALPESDEVRRPWWARRRASLAAAVAAAGAGAVVLAERMGVLTPPW